MSETFPVIEASYTERLAFYEEAKEELREKDLTPQEYEEAIKKLVKELDI